MTKTTAELRTLTTDELRDMACKFQARITIDGYDTAARYNRDRINSELSRRERLCRVDHPDVAAHAVCALLDGHGGDHRALIGTRWA